MPPGYSFYIGLNPDYLLELAREYFQHSDLTIDSAETEKLQIFEIPAYVKKGNRLLSLIIK